MHASKNPAMKTILKSCKQAFLPRSERDGSRKEGRDVNHVNGSDMVNIGELPFKLREWSRRNYEGTGGTVIYSLIAGWFL